MSEQDLLLL